MQPGPCLAVAPNGTVAATCRAFLDKGSVSYGAVVPRASFSFGRNQIGVYEVGPGNSLIPLGGN